MFFFSKFPVDRWVSVLVIVTNLHSIGTSNLMFVSEGTSILELSI